MAVLLVDRREQLPLPFAVNEVFHEIRPATLPLGDYGCVLRDGTAIPLVFERKGLNDLYGTMTSGYPRFKRRLLEAQQCKVQMILMIEGSLGTVLQGTQHSQFSGESCVKKLFTLAVKYDLYPVFCVNRGEMVRFITEVYAALGRLHVASAKASRQDTDVC